MLGDVKAGDYVDVFATIFAAEEQQGSADAATASGTPRPAGANNGPAHLLTGSGRIFTRRLLTEGARARGAANDQSKVKGGLAEGREERRA